jgi:CYTH domain-containing protein
MALTLQIFGEKGGCAGLQEQPNQLYWMPLGGRLQIIERGEGGLSPEADRTSRVTIGHAEGMPLAFANIYTDLAEAIRRVRKDGYGSRSQSLPPRRRRPALDGGGLRGGGIRQGGRPIWVDARPPMIPRGKRRVARHAVESSKAIVQAYVAIDGDTSMRVRISDETRAELTVKVGVSDMTRHEFEYSIPVADARAMTEASRGRLIEKTRHILTIDGFVWEVDAYEGTACRAGDRRGRDGLRELTTPSLPSWLGREVTGDPAWSNAMLAMNGRPGRWFPDELPHQARQAADR